MAIQIEQALNQKLNAYATGKSIPVEWDFYNDGAEPSLTGIHFRQNLLPADVVIIGMENTGSNDHTGIYQIMVCGQAGKPSGSLKTEVDLVLAEFSRGQLVTYDGVTVIIEGVNHAQPLYSEAYVKIPISVSYRAIISNAPSITPPNAMTFNGDYLTFNGAYITHS